MEFELRQERIPLTITLTEPLLGTVPKDEELYGTYIASKAPTIELGEEELETVETIEERGWTGFHKDKNGLFIYDYMVKGQIKAACEVLQANEAIKKVPAYKKWLDLLLFVEPRRLYFGTEQPDGCLERPLRIMTPKGPRTSLTRSDFMEAGRSVNCELILLHNIKNITMDTIQKCLYFGRWVGLGQWRGSGGYGRFVFEENQGAIAQAAK